MARKKVLQTCETDEYIDYNLNGDLGPVIDIYSFGDPCPQCKLESNRPCIKCGRIAAAGRTIIRQRTGASRIERLNPLTIEDYLRMSFNIRKDYTLVLYLKQNE